MGLLEDIRVHDVPTSGGTYWIRTANGSLFTGVATNLRTQLDSFVQRIGHRVDLPIIRDRAKDKPELLLRDGGSFEDCEVIRAGVFKCAGSRMNFWNGTFFGSAA
jgi:hypothetical protein